jgi:hypothetical protein
MKCSSELYDLSGILIFELFNMGWLDFMCLAGITRRGLGWHPLAWRGMGVSAAHPVEHST